MAAWIDKAKCEYQTMVSLLSLSREYRLDKVKTYAYDIVDYRCRRSILCRSGSLDDDAMVVG
jgi:hypothetical protein